MRRRLVVLVAVGLAVFAGPGCGEPEGETGEEHAPVSTQKNNAGPPAGADFLRPFEVVIDSVPGGGIGYPTPQGGPLGDMHAVIHTKTSVVAVGDKRILARKDLYGPAGNQGFGHNWDDISDGADGLDDDGDAIIDELDEGAPAKDFVAAGVTNDGHEVWVVSSDCTVGSCDF